MENRYSNAGPSDAVIAANEKYERRVRELEAEGMTTSDAQAVVDVEVAEAEAPPPAFDIKRQHELRSFVAIGPGEWARAQTLQMAVDAVRKRLREPAAVMPKGKTRAVLTVYGSNGDLEVFADDYGCKVRAKPGRLLVTFLI